MNTNMCVYEDRLSYKCRYRLQFYCTLNICHG